MFFLNEDWRIELLLLEEDEHIKKFKKSSLKKVKLGSIAEVFRDKSILKKDVGIGKIYILNISNINNGKINYDSLDTLDDDDRKIRIYELNDGDVILTCRGTAMKVALFKKQDKRIIASANLIVIRPKEGILGGYLKIFLESPVGISLINSFQRGTMVFNINHSDLSEMEIPLLPLNLQNEMVKKYDEEFNNYEKTVLEAETRWKNVKNNLFEKLI